jgi:hypothetical protein
MGVTDDERRRRVLDALRPEAVLSHFGIKARRSGDEFRIRRCPQCGERSTESVCVDALTGLWCCHPHDCRGDIFALVAGFAGLDCKRDFCDVLERGERIAGITPHGSAPIPRSTPARTDRPPDEPTSTANASRGDTAVTHEAYTLDEAARRATAMWQGLPEVSDAGAAYLKSRGLEALVGTPAVRYAPLTTEPMTPWGKRAARLLSRPAICVPVHAVDDGTIINVVSRRLDVRSADDPKVVSLPAMKKVLHGRLLGTFGSWRRFREHPRDVVVVEGVFDYLTAAHLWPDKLVIGADGAALLPKIGALVAPAVRDAGARLLLVPHSDDAGYLHGRATCGQIVRAGLPIDRVRFIDIGYHNDLNDAFVAGEVPVVD